jgi:hypothetical protein
MVNDSTVLNFSILYYKAIACDFKMECYVCTEDCYTLSPCKCTNLALCNDCYAKLLIYGNKRCSICLDGFPIEEEIIMEEGRREGEELFIENELNAFWIVFPIMMRPHPHTTFPECSRIDAAMDIIRNAVFFLIYYLIYEAVIQPEHFFMAEGLMFGLIVHIVLCVCIRHTCAKNM